MRPLRLDMEGFGTFAQATTVDFGGVDFFALVGNTGAGKSTVLDAICFALYGRVPRWGSGIEYALAPSATSGKVRLVFAADGKSYVATRVVKRGGKGKVTTSAAALERLASDVDVTDLGEVGGLIGTALAGSAKGVTEHVERIVGLPFDQFTKCVLLPQGAFAEFLHSSAADRRKILENLLGYAVYRDIQSAAGERHRTAEAVLAHIDHELAGLETVTDEAVAAVDARITRFTDLLAEMRRRAPDLDALTAKSAAAQNALRDVDAEHALLTYIRRPTDVDLAAEAVTEATDAVAVARKEVAGAESDEERLRAKVSDTDLSTIDRLLTEHRRLAELADNVATGTRLTGEAQAAADAAERERRERADAVADAERAVSDATTADLAAALREHLHPGQACPVCEQDVENPPAAPASGGLAAAKKRLAEAKRALADAEKRLSGAHKTVADYSGRLALRVDEQTALDRKLADAPSVAQLTSERAAAIEAGEALSAAAERVRSSRDTLRRKESALENATRRLTGEWQKFDHHRDRVAALGPPPANRSDLSSAWRELADWAEQALADRQQLRSTHAETLATLDDQTRSIRNELSVALTDAQLPRPAGETGGDFIEAAAHALRGAETDRQRLSEQRARFVQLTEQRADQAHRAQVAKQLHSHLGTRQFVNWLLSEALDELVAGASEILRRLTSGQYDLVYLDNDFYVVDHHDADLTRPAKTLSGGETFTAALSLALAMSDQLAGMSSKGACLEAILLDEGFGTLDAATLDQVAANLESLAGSGDRLVGVVTHVPALAERIPVRFEVTKDARGSHVNRSET